MTCFVWITIVRFAATWMRFQLIAALPPIRWTPRLRRGDG